MRSPQGRFALPTSPSTRPLPCGRPRHRGALPNHATGVPAAPRPPDPAGALLHLSRPALNGRPRRRPSRQPSPAGQTRPVHDSADPFDSPCRWPAPGRAVGWLDANPAVNATLPRLRRAEVQPPAACGHPIAARSRYGLRPHHRHAPSGCQHGQCRRGRALRSRTG